MDYIFFTIGDKGGNLYLGGTYLNKKCMNSFDYIVDILINVMAGLC